MSKYRVMWSMWGHVFIDADSEDDAMEKAGEWLSDEESPDGLEGFSIDDFVKESKEDN